MAKSAMYPANGDRTPSAQAQRETHWRRVLERCEKSGLTRTAFAEREGINESSLHWWARVLRERDETRRPRARTRRRGRNQKRQARSAFLPVRVMESAPSPTAAPLEVLTRTGRVVRVPIGFDEATLRRVVTALENQSC
jgi:hypothetical protein